MSFTIFFYLTVNMFTDRAMEKLSKLPLLEEQTRGLKVFLKVDVSLQPSST